ncbi:SagB family peptide dehydrogenase [Micromonospora sp. CPCC 205546]|uniref:SagB family peptide dehydrogenase n=1 Tax=Micromonospora sp. CPCC 205546 TaxID=3122397 RepID=UPI002FF310CC
MPSDADTSRPGPSLSLWSFRDDVTIETAEDGTLTILSRWGDVPVGRPTPAVEEVLHRMTYGPVALGNVAGLDAPVLRAVFDRLPGRVVRSLGSRDSPVPLLSVQPVSPLGVLELPEVAEDRSVRLSRFAFAHQRDGELVIESPLSHHRVVLHRPQAALVLGGLPRATSIAEVGRKVGLAPPVVADVVTYLVGAGMVVVGEAGTSGFPEDTDPTLRTWSPYDLLFHSRSRLGTHDEPAGATFRHVATVPPPPAVKPAPAGPRIPMYRPPVPVPHGMTLTEAVDRRRSTHTFAEAAPSTRDLGELLFHAARIRMQTVATAPDNVRYTVTRRPYPSAGSLYELELYLTVDRSPDLRRGIYHYSPADHALTLVNASPADVDELLDNARVSVGGRRPPPVLITMTARAGRLSWVYESIAYATTLKHVGMLQQTLCLVATMLGLATCALTMGDARVSASAFGLDWPAEVGVGEFAIGLPENDISCNEEYLGVHGM